jgi:ribonuclease III
VDKKYAPLCEAIGYSFSNEKLLALALHHRSSSGESNERLEFLGDSVLGVVISHEIFVRYPSMPEGEMSRLRASLVNGDTLATLALGLGFDRFLVLGVGEQKSGGKNRPSILADALEAVIAAIYLDAGLDQVRRSILIWFSDLLSQTIASSGTSKDAKSSLQEWMQAHQLPLPTYTLVTTTGKAHCQEFTVECGVEGLEYKTTGVSTARRRAEQIAAAEFLEIIYDKH